MGRWNLKSAVMQAFFIGAAAGNIQSAQFLGHGSVIWCAFVLLMFVSLAVLDASFTRLLVVALMASPTLYLWQSVHRVEPSSTFLAVELGFFLLCSQVAVACVLGYRKFSGGVGE